MTGHADSKASPAGPRVTANDEWVEVAWERYMAPRSAAIADYLRRLEERGLQWRDPEAVALRRSERVRGVFTFRSLEPEEIAEATRRELGELNELGDQKQPRRRSRNTLERDAEWFWNDEEGLCYECGRPLERIDQLVRLADGYRAGFGCPEHAAVPGVVRTAVHRMATRVGAPRRR